MRNQKKKFQELKKRWQEMIGMFDNQQKRGRQFQEWLIELFQASGLKAQGSVTRKAPKEEFDGVIYEGKDIFLLEAKWKKKPININPIRTFHDKIKRGTINTYGILVSVSSFTKNAIQHAEEMKPTRLFLIDIHHIEALLEQKIKGKIWINTLVKIATLYAKKFISIGEIFNENNIPPSQNPIPLSENPFQRFGPLDENNRSYVKRECDSELADIINSGEKKLIAIHGDPEIGKSSLMKRVMHLPFLENSNWVDFYLDMQPLGPSIMEDFADNFLEYFSSELNSKINSWEEMERFLVNQPVVLCIDEFGEFTYYPKIAKHFIQNLCVIVQKNDNLRIVICYESTIEDFFDQFPKKFFNHPKYRRCWENIEIFPFSESQAKQLLSYLPKNDQLDTQSIALKKISKIKEFSFFKPRKLQCLCHKLFNIFYEGANESQLIDIIDNRNSYS